MKPKTAGYILIIFHLVGVIGLLSPYRKEVLAVTPYNILLSAILLFWFDERKKSKFWVFGLACVGLGLVAESIGVNTGYLFGDYHYGPVLGYKWQGVPLLIGLNWWTLSYVSAHFAQKAFPNSVWTGAFGAAMMVAWDYLIEPVAINLNFWKWHSAQIPIYNYVCWFLIALPLQWMAQKWKIGQNNPLASWFLVSQVLFFLLLGLLKR